jgi:formylmethanofuran dehydrogenase subunit E
MVGSSGVIALGSGKEAAVISNDLLQDCAARHARLCPRQVLGLRIGLLGGALLGLGVPRRDKRLIAIAETDGCAVDGISVATGCTVGRRTLKIMDFGKVAATFLDTQTGEAVRIWPRSDVREASRSLLPEAPSRWHAQLEAYQCLPDADLLVSAKVSLQLSEHELLGVPGCRILCSQCGEEIMNRREVVIGGRVLCRGCAGDNYWVRQA